MMNRTILPLLAGLVVWGCTPGKSTTHDTGFQADTAADTGDAVAVDADGDGFTVDADCDDTDATVYPGADETCNGKDDDCDGVIDDDPVDGSTWYSDADADGYGDPASLIIACDLPDGAVDNAGDCDDDEPSAWTGAAEICDDGVDNDCDGTANGCELSGEYALGADSDARLEDSAWLSAACSLDMAGDVNGDGLGDLIVGAPGDGDPYGRGQSRAYLLLGPVSGKTDFMQADARLDNERAHDLGGAVVAGAGDWNGDGFDDLAIAPFPALQEVTYLVFGPISGRHNLSESDVRLLGDVYRDENSGFETSDSAGWPLAGGADLTGDGSVDLLVGAGGLQQADRTVSGGAYVVPGGATEGNQDMADGYVLTGESEGDWASYGLAILDDTNGDGFADLAVTAPYNDESGDDAGAAYVVLGPLTADRTLAEADAKLLGEQAGSEVTAVDGAGDVNGDGYADLVVGSRLDPSTDGSLDDAGAAYILLGPISGKGSLSGAEGRWVGRTRSEGAGQAVCGPGDVDGDGFDDVLVGAPWGPDYWSSEREVYGTAYLVYGPATGSWNTANADATFNGETDSWGSASTLAGGDVNGDGLADLVIGDWHRNGGTMYLMFGHGL